MTGSGAAQPAADSHVPGLDTPEAQDRGKSVVRFEPQSGAQRGQVATVFVRMLATLVEGGDASLPATGG